MKKKIQTLHRLLKEWCQSTKTIFGILLVGSYARGTQTNQSDVDIMVIVENKDTFLEDLTWVDQFGLKQSISFENYGKVTSVRVGYENIEVEFSFGEFQWISLPFDPGTSKVLNDGFKVIAINDSRVSLNLESFKGTKQKRRLDTQGLFVLSSSNNIKKEKFNDKD